MYKLNSIVTYDYEVPLPKCMYELKNINPHVGGMTEKDLKISEQKSSHKMSELENRQAKLLEQLDSLQKVIKDLKASCNVVEDPMKREKLKEGSLSKQDALPKEIVISASAEFLPFTLQCMQKLLPDSIALNVTYHIHSSLPSDKALKVHEFMKGLSKNCYKKGACINVRLIFMDVSANTEMKLSTIMTTPIRGEMNILRYFSYLLPEILVYDEEFRAEAILDVCHQLQRNKFNKSNIESVFIYLNNDWICGKEKTVADIAVFTILKQLNYPIKNLSTSAKAWYDKCKKVFE